VSSIIPNTDELLGRFLLSSPIVLFTCEACASWNPVFVSANILPRWGYTPDEFLQTGFWLECVHVEDRTRFEEGFIAAFRGKSLVRDYRMRHASGAWCWIRDHLTPRFEGSQLIAIDGELENHTDLRLMEEETRNAEERFAKTFQIVPVGIAISGLQDGVFLDVNQRFEDLFGWKRGELLHHSSLELGFWENTEERARMLEDLAEYGFVRDREVWFHRHDGSRILINLCTQQIPFGSEQYILSVFTDITERHEIEERIQEKSVEMERFVYTVSHDLKSPLITITGFLEILTEDFKEQNESSFLENIARVSQASKRMKIMLENLLELSRVGRKMNPHAAFSMNGMVEEVLEMVSGQIKDVSANVTVAPDLGSVTGDRVLLTQVFENLVVNAVKFSSGTERVPELHIGVRKQKKERVFFVQDNGVGIEAKFLPSIFGLFEKLDARSSGTGVGLAIAKRAVELHGGRIWAESAGKNMGTTFCLVLP